MNRLDGDDKEYGYIIDYKDLFKSLEVRSRTTLPGPSTATTRRTWPACWKTGWERPASGWRRPRKPCKALCEPVEAAEGHGGLSPLLLRGESATPNSSRPTNRPASRFTSSRGLRARVRQHRQRDAGGRLFAAEIETLKAEVDHYEKVRKEVKLASGDYIDLKMYEPAMRHLIDTYIHADESEKDLGVRRRVAGPAHRRAGRRGRRLPAAGHPENPEAVAETIENNVRKLIIDEQPINPKYYERMSELLDALIAQRRQDAIDYQKYLERVVELARQVMNPTTGQAYPGRSIPRRSGRSSTT